MTAPGPTERRGLLGAVLAGGASRRFGSPKALARLHGRALWRLGAERLARICDRVAVVANDPAVRDAVDRTDAVELLGDRRPGAGPLGGIDAALHAATEAGLGGALVLAADMPWTEAAALERLAGEWRAWAAEVDGGRATSPVAARSAWPWGFEPLCAVYPAEALSPLESALDKGALEAGAFARSLEPRVVETGLSHCSFRSVNRPEDLPPPTVSVVGNKNSGKTTLAVALLAELARRGRRVMSAKHGHRFRLDAPGTDSWRHRSEGGAERVLLAGPSEFALIGDWAAADDERAASEPSLDLLLSRHLRGAEIVVAEGFRDAPVPKVEIYRAAAQPEPVLPPRAARRAGALAVVTDRPDLPWSVPVFEVGDPRTVPGVAEVVERALLGSPSTGAQASR